MSSQMCGDNKFSLDKTLFKYEERPPECSPERPGVKSDSQNEVRTRLPKHEMKRFNGGPSELQAFIDCFDCGVHSNSKAQWHRLDEPSEVSFTRSSCCCCEQKTDFDINKLQHMQLGSYWRKVWKYTFDGRMLSLPVVNSVSVVKGIRQLHDKTEVHIQGFTSLGGRIWSI